MVDYDESHDHPRGTYYVDLDERIVVLSCLDKVIPDVDPVDTYEITQAPDGIIEQIEQIDLLDLSLGRQPDSYARWCAYRLVPKRPQLPGNG